MVIDNRMDKDEERRIDQKKYEHKKELEKKMQQESMRTFEAKLSEKTAKELTDHDQKHLYQKAAEQKSHEEKESLIDSIINAATSKEADEQDHGQMAAIKHDSEHEYEAKQYKVKERRTEQKQDDSTDVSTEGVQQKGSGEVSNEGYKRVAEKQDGQGSGGSSGEGKDSQMGSDSGQSFGSSKDDSKGKQKLAAHAAGVFPRFVRFDGSNLQGGFDQHARNFETEDLDEIVNQVEYGMNEIGEEHFTVTLNDDYYNGLKVQAKRTPDGVVLTFACPNVAVRSTFLKYRTKLYKHFAKREVSVFRIDVY